MSEADQDGDGKINYNEFEDAMKDVFRKSWLRPCDQSPSKSISPTRSIRNFDLNAMSPVKFIENPEDDWSPIKKTVKKDNDGQIISPERGNPFLNAATPSPSNKRRNRGGDRDRKENDSGDGFKLISIKEE